MGAIKTSTSEGRRVHSKRWGHAGIALYVIGLLVFLELSSSLVLSNLISSGRLERFDALLIKGPTEYGYALHPFLEWTDSRYRQEQERYFGLLGEELSDRIVIVALGASTTRTGYPAYTESFINRRLRELNSSLEAMVFNFGVDGWNSIHSFQNYVYLVRYLHPDFVIIHHNTNDNGIWEEAFRQSVLILPHSSPVERALLLHSKFYKLLRFVYFLSYNHLHYGEGVVYSSEQPGLPMAAHISSSLNDEGERVWEGVLLQDAFWGRNASTYGVTTGFIIAENYESFTKYVKSDGSTPILTTQYLNYSKRGDSSLMLEEWVKDYHMINDIIRNVSREENVALVDLDEKMEPFDHLLKEDGVHFVEEGIKLKGELVGETILDILEERYNLTG